MERDNKFGKEITFDQQADQLMESRFKTVWAGEPKIVSKAERNPNAKRKRSNK